jgi:hypothetical protein
LSRDVIPQKRESSLVTVFWTPAFAGVTAYGSFSVSSKSYNPLVVFSPFSLLLFSFYLSPCA